MDWPPDYVAVYAERQRRLLALRRDPSLLIGAREYYRTQPPAVFIEHWCDTYDPRNAGGALPARLPFVLFKRQRELTQFLHSCVVDQESGLVEKARDMGATWIACSYSVWLWLFQEGAAIGWGSRKEQLVDKIGDPDSILEKIRMQIRSLPPEFLPQGFKPDVHMPFMRIINPETSATITGEAGDNIGRGGRKLVYFKDESAHYERPESVEAALSENTRVQIDISSVNGVGNVFHRRREAGWDWVPEGEPPPGRVRVFVMDWRDHPAKSVEWYEQRRRRFSDEGMAHVFAQEVDRNYAAAVQGTIIPYEWIQAAVDAHLALGFGDDGAWMSALDVADSTGPGGDLNAQATRKGVVLHAVEDWGAQDTGQTARRAVSNCRLLPGPVLMMYDSIGVGSGIKAETNRLLAEGQMPPGLTLVPWNAGAEVLFPDEHVIPGDDNSPTNFDFYYNLKAQGWWNLRRRFELTWRARNEPGFTWRADDLISLDSKIPQLVKAMKELSQPTAGQSTGKMKLIVNKTPDGSRSPNMGDVIMMCYWPVLPEAPLTVSAAVLTRARQMAMAGRRF